MALPRLIFISCNYFPICQAIKELPKLKYILHIMCPKLTLVKKIPVIECEGKYDLITQVTTAKKEVPFYQDII